MFCRCSHVCISSIDMLGAGLIIYGHLAPYSLCNVIPLLGLIYLLFSPFMLKAMNKILWWISVNGSCIPWAEVALWIVNGSSLACINQFQWSSETHVERNKMFIWFNKKNNLKSNFWTCNLNRDAEMFTPKGPVAGSLQQTLWPRERAWKVAILSCAFAFFFG